MQYSSKEYEFLGKQVAAGKYVSRSAFFLAMALTLVLGLLAGWHMAPGKGGDAPRFEASAGGAGGKAPEAAMDDTAAASIRQHEAQVLREPENAEAWTHLGDLYFDTNQPAKSVAAYEKALAIAPNNPNVLVDCGVMYRALEQYDKALEYFKKALSVNPKHEFALFNSGIVLYHDLKKEDEGLHFWRELVRINPQAKLADGRLLSSFIEAHTKSGNR